MLHFSRPLSAAFLALALAACSKPAGTGAPGRGAGGPPVPVLAGEVVEKEMPVIVRAIGSVQSPSTVTVKPQVGGKVAETHFKEGTDVRQGDLLFTIDKRPFEVALAQARAALVQAEAQAQNAAGQAERYTSLDKSGSVAKEQVEQFTSASKSSQAAVLAAEAAVRNAELQLDYCSVRAPFSGRAGRFLVDAGNVVRANETDLVVINQIAPIEVRFAVPEQHLSEIARYTAEGPLHVMALPEGDAPRSSEGTLTFVDNAVKPTSGTIDLSATFPNENEQLWPGQFVTVELRVRVEPDAVVAPARAVQTGQQGAYVFVIGGNATVETRPVVIDRTLADQVVVREGLKPGERVVVDGQSRLSKGSKVEVKPSLEAAAAPQTAAVKAGGDPPAARQP